MLHWRANERGIGRHALADGGRYWTQAVVVGPLAMWGGFFIRDGSHNGVVSLCPTREEAEQVCETWHEQHGKKLRLTPGVSTVKE
jgi:hypothetical protein